MCLFPLASIWKVAEAPRRGCNQRDPWRSWCTTNPTPVSPKQATQTPMHHLTPLHRDRRYEYKGLNKEWKGKLDKAKVWRGAQGILADHTPTALHVVASVCKDESNPSPSVHRVSRLQATPSGSRRPRTCVSSTIRSR